MKKIEAIVRRRNFSIVKDSLSDANTTYIIDKRNLDDSNIYDKPKESSSVDSSSNLKPIPLAKIEIVVSNKDARKVVEMISKTSGLSSDHGGKIFVSEMDEVVDMQTLDGKQDLEVSPEIKLKRNPRQLLPKRSRFVPLQKFTLHKLQVIYEKNKETLHVDYKIKSFSDFANYCIVKSLPTLEEQLKNPTIIYKNSFSDF